MANGKIPLVLTLLLMGLLITALLTVQPYSADWPARAFTKPARAYIRAAIREDSVGLLRLSTSMVPVIWALDAARGHRDTLALWERRIRAWTGNEQGDTTEVFVYPAGEMCEKAPIVLRFVGSGAQAKVVRARSACLDPS